MEIYMDNAATTPMCREAVTAMRQFYSGYYYNPSAGYSSARRIHDVVEEKRAQIAGLIGASPDEIYFTSGGTESDNWAISSGTQKRAHIISTPIEHKAVLMPLKNYRTKGGAVSFLKTDKTGMVRPNDLRRMIMPSTGLISVMAANNEIGVIEPIEEIGHIAREYEIAFHTDAVQAFGHIPVDVEKWCVDMLSASAHKFGGPKGTGFMYIRRDCKISPMIRGGAQERMMRAGTENVPGIVGMAAAAQKAVDNMEQNSRHCRMICNHMTSRILSEIPGVVLNGPQLGPDRLPNNMNFGFEGIDATSMLTLLDVHHVAASAGSACNTTSGEYSHVLKAVGTEDKYIGGIIRLSIDEKITLQMADYVVNIIKSIVNNLRSAN